MPIDDPISAIQTLNASDDRQRSPLFARAKQFLDIVKLFWPPGAPLTITGAEVAFDWANRRDEQNRRELVDAIAEELKHHRQTIEHLFKTSKEHERFMNDEMQGLVLDALRRAEQTRAKERIRRLGQILVHAAEFGPQEGADQVEEMMRLAVELTDTDVLVLKGVVRAQDTYYSYLSQYAVPYLGIPALQGISPNIVLSICGKLQSLGLITTPQRRAAALNETTIPRGGGFVMLERGAAFLRFVSGSATESARAPADRRDRDLRGA